MSDLKPFTPRTTETIERANRFLAFRDSPYFNQLFRLSQQLVDEARLNQKQFKGWDTQQIVTLAIRVQVAEEYHEQLFARMASAIVEGVAEATQTMSAQQASEQSDQFRDQILKRMDSESRVPGSY